MKPPVHGCSARDFPGHVFRGVGSDPRPRQFVAAAQSGVKDFQAWQALSRTAVQSLRHFKVPGELGLDLKMLG